MKAFNLGKTLILLLTLCLLSDLKSQQILDEMELRDISNDVSIRSIVIRDPDQALLVIKTQISGLRIQSNNIIYRSELVEPGTWHVRLAPGTHRLSFQAEGFISIQERFYFNAKEVKGTHIRVIPTPERKEEKNVGYVVIDSEPDNAQIYLNDQFYGTTPYMGKLLTGSYRMQLLKDLYNVYEDTLVIVTNRTLPVNVTMIPLMGTISISSQPNKATIEIDGRPVGETPLKYDNLELGTHKIELKLTRYEDYSREIVIDEENLHQDLNIKLIEKKSYLAVSGAPAGSQVSIDGKKKGVLPVDRVSLPYGYHNLKVSRAGFHAYEEAILLSKPDIHTITVNLEPKNRLLSSIYSSVLPGSGQIYAGQMLKGVIIGVGTVGSLAATFYLKDQYKQNKEQYFDDKEIYEMNIDRDKMDQYYGTMIDSYDKMESSYNTMRITAGITVAVWVYNIIDSYIFFPDQSGVRLGGMSNNNISSLSITLKF